MARPSTFVVVGGGVAGLAAAWEARQRGDFERIVVLEAGARWGGKLATTHISLPDGSGILVDEGADAVLARRPEALQLCEELGLTDELTTPAVGRAKVFVGGSMQFLPARTALGVPFDCEDPDVAAILGPAGVEELRQHDAVDHPALTEDTAIGPLLRARLGPTMVERIVGPLVGGINAGDIDRLSTAAVVPAIFTAAQRGGSLTAAVASAAAPNDGPVFVALRGGMERLIGRLVEVLDERGVELRLNAPVTEISAARRGARLRTLTEDVDADATVITTPANIAATLLASTSPAAADLLAGIEHASVALLTLLYERSEVPVPLDASGVLIPRSEGAATTAISWGSSKWAHWNDGRHVILRASIGHDGDERGRVWSDEQLVDAVRADLRLVMGITAPPAAVRTSRWLDGFPQYRPGHSSLVQRIHDHLAVDAPTVALAGMAYDGVGIPASIGTGRRAAAHLSDRLSDRN